MSIPREQQTTKERPCPICGHWSWCCFTEDLEVVWCGHEGHGAFAKSKGGWLHRLASPRPIPVIRKKPRPTRLVPKVDFAVFNRLSRRALTTSIARALADELQVGVKSLRRQELGWATQPRILATGTKCSGDGCWTFPMRNAAGAIVGIRLRTRSGFKYAINSGDGSGLIIPQGLQPGGILFLPEGPTSNAALLTLGLNSVGRPNNRAGIENLLPLLRRLRPACVAVVGDNDEGMKKNGRVEWPGRDGAWDVALALAEEHRNVRVLMPPGPSHGMAPEGVKDSREWLQRGAVAADVIERLNAAPRAQPEVRCAI